MPVGFARRVRAGVDRIDGGERPPDVALEVSGFISRENCRRTGAFSGTSISPSAGSLKITSGGGPICGIGGASAFRVSTVGLVSATCCPSIHTRPLPFRTTPVVSSHVPVSTRAPMSRLKPLPRGRRPVIQTAASALAEHEVPLAEPGPLRRISVQIPPAKLSRDLHALPDVGRRIQRDLAQRRRAIRRLHRHGVGHRQRDHFARARPVSFESFGKQTVEAER